MVLPGRTDREQLPEDRKYRRAKKVRLGRWPAGWGTILRKEETVHTEKRFVVCAKRSEERV